MSQEDIKNMRTLDEVAERAGGFTSGISTGEIHYNYREISRYCKRNLKWHLRMKMPMTKIYERVISNV